LSDKNSCLNLTRSDLKKVRSNEKAEKVTLDSCYTEDFVDRLNDHEFVGAWDYSNEVFLYYYVKCMEFCELLKSSDSSRSDIFSRIIDKSLFLKARVISGHKVNFLEKALNFTSALVGFNFSIIAIFLLSILLPFYLIRKKGIDRPIVDNVNKKLIFIIRSKAAYQKCRVKIEGADSSITFYDNYSTLSVPGLSIYSVINWKNIFLLSAKSAIYALRDVKGLFFDGRRMLDTTCALALFPEYIKKVSHKAVYESCLNEVVRSFQESVFYTGDKDDRFALLQTRICRREKKQLFCLPHGLEYGFHFPGGLSATTFYCFTPEAASFLNNLYEEKKFVYSESVVDEMYGFDFEKRKKNDMSDRLCFFTEPRDTEVNYEIIKNLTRECIKFSLKLHPLESSEQYRELFPEIEQIEDFDEAISSAACLARKSTVLLEASRRGAKSIALLVNEKDRAYVMKIFPSLCL
jgi:hypothetical protein